MILLNLIAADLVGSLNFLFKAELRVIISKLIITIIFKKGNSKVNSSITAFNIVILGLDLVVGN